MTKAKELLYGDQPTNQQKFMNIEGQQKVRYSFNSKDSDLAHSYNRGAILSLLSMVMRA